MPMGIRLRAGLVGVIEFVRRIRPMGPVRTAGAAHRASTYAAATLVRPYLECPAVPGLEFVLTESGMTIGRAADCSFRIEDSVPGAQAVSRHHARFELRRSRWCVIDGAIQGQPSTNGVYVNGKRTLDNFLFDGVEIRLAGVPFRFRLQRPGNPSGQGLAP